MKHLIFITIVLLLCGCDQYSMSKQRENVKYKWKATYYGVKYYEECIDGNVFYVTKSHGNDNRQLAGPVKECNKAIQ